MATTQATLATTSTNLATNLATTTPATTTDTQTGTQELTLYLDQPPLPSGEGNYRVADADCNGGSKNNP